ncbi:MAG: hypothetical protein Q9227_007666 [Pyrenula ochraceoflavens]
MQDNVDQHDAFQKGLEECVDWVEQCEKNGGKGYDGKKMKSMIDNFGPPLERHMHEEIDSLLSVRDEYDQDGEKCKKLFLEFEAEVQKTLELSVDIPWVLANQDYILASSSLADAVNEMDVLAITEGRASFDEEARTLSNGQIEPDLQPTETDNKFQKAIAAWKGVDLSNLISKLDSTASDIVSDQRDSLVQRKELAQKTKDFRKLDDAGKIAEHKGLLKAYQVFIDLLTTQGKASSSAFLQLYSSLSEAPDPYPLLEASIESLLLSEETVPKLSAEKEQLQKTISRLTGQLEETERQLHSERDTRKELQEHQDARIKEVEASWSKVVEEKQSNWEAKERMLEEKVENQDRLLKETKASYEVSQRLGSEAGPETQASAATAELEILSSDLEKTGARLADMEARNEQLRMELAQSVSQRQSERQTESIEDDPSFVRLRSENSSLLRKLDAARYDKDLQKNDWENRLRQGERQRLQVVAENENLRSKVEKWSDYEELKRELEVIKSIEFSGAPDEEDEQSTHEATSEVDSDSVRMNGSASKSKKETLEQLLLARNKKLSDELTVLRVSHRDLQQQLENMQEELSRTNAELEKSQNLSSTLENDLTKLQQEASSILPSGAMSVAGTFTSRHPQSSRRGRTSPTSSIISGFDGRSSVPNLEALRAGEPVGGGSGILPMIQAQRDRFKQKHSQLEEELAKTYNTVTSLRQEVASLQKDNLSLYEKSRYVSTYSRNNPASSSSAYGNPSSHTSAHTLPEVGGGSSMERYRTQYEANISPFAAFRGRETARAYKRMSLPERVVFSITRLVLATRTSRNLFAGYCLALHFMIFLMLYWMGTIEVEKHASNLGEAAVVAAAAKGVGGSSGSDLSHGDWQQEGFAGR